MAIYTVGVWTVKSGREQDFIDAWNAMATATAVEFPGWSAVLLRDRDAPTKFISSGPWESLEQIETWRGSDIAREGVGSIRAVIDGFESHTMDVAAAIG